MSVTALDKKTLVDLDEGELAEIRAAYTNCDGAFSEAELSHLYDPTTSAEPSIWRSQT